MDAVRAPAGEVAAILESSFEDYVAASGPALKRLAFLLTGELGEAEDLLQSAQTFSISLERMWGCDAEPLDSDHAADNRPRLVPPHPA
jgi:hypothetical protein